MHVIKKTRKLGKLGLKEDEVALDIKTICKAENYFEKG